MADEIEVKFMVEAGNKQQLLSAISSSTLKILKEEDLVLENYYFDTPDQLLYKNGIALRVRNSNNSWEMTIKTRKKATAGLHIHPEYNVSLESNPQIPVLRLFPNEIFVNLDIEDLQKKILENMSQKCSRRVMLVQDQETKAIVEISFDDVTYKGQSGPIKGKELEFELKEGLTSDLLKIISVFINSSSDNLALRIGSLSKMHRAAIYAGISPIPIGEKSKQVIDEHEGSNDELYTRLISVLDSNEIEYLLSDKQSAKENLLATLLDMINIKELKNSNLIELQEHISRVFNCYVNNNDNSNSLNQSTFRKLLTDKYLVMARLKAVFAQQK